MRNEKNILMIVLIVVIVLLLFGGLGYGSMNLFGGYSAGYYGFSGLVGVIAILLAIWVIYDVLVNNKGLSDGMKVLWIICAVLFNIITAIIYYLVGRNGKNDLFRKK